MSRGVGYFLQKESREEKVAYNLVGDPFKSIIHYLFYWLKAMLEDNDLVNPYNIIFVFQEMPLTLRYDNFVSDMI